MSRILFSHTYFQKLDPKQVAIGQPYAPLATITAAAVMREAGHQIALFDTQFASGPGALRLEQDGKAPDYFVLYDDGFNYLTKMCLTNMREAALEMIRMARQKNIPILISSSDATDHVELYLDAGADFVLIGEAELTLRELTAALDAGKDFDTIPGLVYRKAEKIFSTAPRKVMSDLDTLPLPAWDLIDFTPYRDAWIKSSGYFSINLATTRGCPYKCNWCAKPIYGNRYNSRSPAHVVEEILFLQTYSRFDHIWFCDDIFGLKPGWVVEFEALLRQKNISISYKIQSRADLLVQDKYVKALADSGCETVWLGAESGSQKILDAMDKGTTVAQITESTRLLKQHGIHPAFFLQFGYPGETREDIDATIRLVNELLPEDIGISISYPLPGTKFHERVKEELTGKSNWTDSNDLSLMFRNTYPPAFYRQLHRYVHKNYRKHQAFESLRQLFSPSGIRSRLTFYRAASAVYYVPAALLGKRKLKGLQLPSSH
jgi:anaerobic magnesium-protoporphyrin IX monomethyl ester cyclase